jgi:hypothetical protein
MLVNNYKEGARLTSAPVRSNCSDPRILTRKCCDRFRSVAEASTRKSTVCGHGIDLSLLEHVSPIEWDHVVLYGQYILDRKLVRQRRRTKKVGLSV